MTVLVQVQDQYGNKVTGTGATVKVVVSGSSTAKVYGTGAAGLVTIPSATGQVRAHSLRNLM